MGGRAKVFGGYRSITLGSLGSALTDLTVLNPHVPRNSIPDSHRGGAAKGDIGPHMWWKTVEKNTGSWSKINVLF